MIDIQTNISGLNELNGDLERFKKSLSENEALFSALITTSRSSVAEMFLNEGASDGFTKWQPLNARYRAWKAKHFPNAMGILDLQGNLRRAILGNNMPASVEKIEKTEATYGVRAGGSKVKVGEINPPNLPYAYQHQTGTDLPERAFLQIGKEQVHRFRQIITEHIKFKLKDAGFKI